ncbi:hypothetical protein L2E82_25751 [Cichorium intybus]|uniref:Uncharacterized protein n=1 Tax=Cichorium intybus TaxID=13427 RepID=A0ACB9E4D1_CICIN|nr:hypothetical protein L2E82_25751 [Cichorium intybus]
MKTHRPSRLSNRCERFNDGVVYVFACSPIVKRTLSSETLLGIIEFLIDRHHHSQSPLISLLTIFPFLNYLCFDSQSAHPLLRSPIDRPKTTD